MPVPLAYFDTSVLIKRYAKERGSSRARALLRSHRFLSSAIAPVEALSTRPRRRAAGDLAEQDFAAIMSRFAKDRGYWELIEVSATVLDRAKDIIARGGVRTLDAIHLASAIVFQNAAGMPRARIPFVTADVQRRDAAAPLGLEGRRVGWSVKPARAAWW